MKFKHLLLVALTFATSLVSAQDVSQLPPLPVDTAVRIGKLDNGLTYYIRHNNWPEHVANFYIAQRVGAIQENEDQRGLAHFLEHMAFNGSEHFPDSTILDYTRNLGVEFGSDLNAYTSIDQTVYRICDVPTKRQAALDSCLLILKDWSNGLTLSDKEIDKERGVIHQEWQMGQGPMMRIYERVLPRLFPGSKYGVRLPIGLMSVVDNFKYKELRDYYKKWYRPDNQAIIIVGDVDVNHMENKIKEYWKGVTVPANAAKVVDEPVPDNDTAIYISDKDKEMQYSQVGIEMKHDVFPDSLKNTVFYLVDDYAKTMVSMMLNVRFNDLTKKADCPFIMGYAYDGEYEGLSKTKDAFNLVAISKEGKDADALKTLYREAQRAREYGFTQSEFDRSKAEYMSQLESQYENRNKIKNSQFGDEYRDNYLEHEPITGIENKYMIMKQMIVPNLGLEDINQYAKELITDNDTNLVVYAYAQEKDGKQYLTEAEMKAAVDGVRGEKIEAYVDNFKNEPLIAKDKEPKPGKIVSEKENKTLGFKELTLSNGARVILKKTDYKENEIRFQGLSKGGKNLYGEKDYNNVKYFDDVIGSCGLGNFSNAELSKALYGKQASAGIGLDRYYQTVSGSSVPKDIETMMQLVYLNFTAQNKDMDSYNSLMSNLELSLKNKDLRPESVLQDSVRVTINGHKKRFAPYNVNDLKDINYDRILQIWKERFSSADGFVFYFVGNFDEATLRPLIEKYLASLPKGKKSNWIDVNPYVNGEIQNRFTRKMETPKAQAFEFRHMPMKYNVDNYVLVDAAGQLLTIDQLQKIREDASAAYSVYSGAGLERFGDRTEATLITVCPMDPKKAGQVDTLLVSTYNDNVEKPDAGDVSKVKETMLKKFDVDTKTNGYWMNVLDEYVSTGVDLYNGYADAVKALTPAKIAGFLKELKDSGNNILVFMMPETK
jgi:zinc protease